MGCPFSATIQNVLPAGRGLFADVQLSPDSGEGQDVVAAVRHFVGGELLVFLADQRIAALENQQITFEGRLLVGGVMTAPPGAAYE